MSLLKVKLSAVTAQKKINVVSNFTLGGEKINYKINGYLKMY